MTYRQRGNCLAPPQGLESRLAPWKDRNIQQGETLEAYSVVMPSDLAQTPTKSGEVVWHEEQLGDLVGDDSRIACIPVKNTI